MLGGLGLVGGLILLLAGSHWFAGAHTVGLILLLVDIVPWAIILVLVLIFGGFGALMFWRDR